MKMLVSIRFLIFATLFWIVGGLEAENLLADNGKVFDLQGFIDRQIQTGTNRVVIPPGHYRVTPKNGTHLRFQNLTNLEIIADGVEMVCTETRQAIGLIQCRNLHLRGLTVDYDPLPMTEGRIVALATNKSWVEFQIISGYPEDNLTERIEIYDPVTGELRRHDSGWVSDFQALGNHRYRIAKNPGYHYDSGQDIEQLGDILVTINQYPPHAGGHAVTLSHCTGVTVEDVTVYASPSFGFLEHQCEANTYLRCKIDRRSQQNDPVKRDFARMRSLAADAFHSTEATKGPAIIDCVAKFMGDDAVNIHGHYAMVTAGTGAVLRVAAPGRLAIEVGDPVEFLPFEGERPPDAVVTKIEPDHPITDGEKTFVKNLRLHQRTKDDLLAGGVKFYCLTLDREVTLPMGSLTASANRVGSGFLVKGCDFGYNRSRGILIKASHGQVLNNTITHGWMAGVLVSPEFWWLESGSSSDVIIAGNKIIGCREPAIQVLAPGGNGKPLLSGAHRDITISSNVISESVWPNIRVTSTSRLVVRDNQLTATNTAGALSRQKRHGQDNETTRAIVIDECFQPEFQPLP